MRFSFPKANSGWVICPTADHTHGLPGSHLFERVSRHTARSGERDRRKTHAARITGLVGSRFHIVISFHDVGSPFEQLRRKSHRHVDRPVILHEAYARPRHPADAADSRPTVCRGSTASAPRPDDRWVYRQRPYRPGCAPVAAPRRWPSRDDTSSRSTPPILAAGHNCARRSANYAGSRATGNRSWATSAVSDNITPRKAHCEESSSARAARVEFLKRTEERHLPRHLRLDGVFLDDLRLCIIVAFGRYADAERRQEPGARHGDLPIRLPRRASRRRPDRGCSPTPAKSTSRASDRGRHATPSLPASESCRNRPAYR